MEPIVLKIICSFLRYKVQLFVLSFYCIVINNANLQFIHNILIKAHYLVDLIHTVEVNHC